MAVREEQSVVIRRPTEEMFACTADPNNDALWESTTLQAERTSESPSDVGPTFRNTTKFLGWRFDTSYGLTEYVPPRKQCYEVTSGPIPGGVCYLFEPSDEGSTRFTQTFEADVGGFFRLTEPLVARAIRRQMEADMETLKDMLEAQVA